MFEEEFLRGYLTEEDVKTNSGLTPKQLQVAMQELINKGLIRVEEKDGKKVYYPTELLKRIKNHVGSDIKLRN